MGQKLGIRNTIQLAETLGIFAAGSDPIVLADDTMVKFVADVFGEQPLKLALDIVKYRTVKVEEPKEKRRPGRPAAATADGTSDKATGAPAKAESAPKPKKSAVA